MALSSLCVVLNALRLNLYKFNNHIPYIKKQKELPKELFHEKKVEYTKTIEVPDMMCENCVSHVRKALESLPDVTRADVSLEKLEAVIHSTVEVKDEDITKAIKDAGYEIGKII